MTRIKVFKEVHVELLCTISARLFSYACKVKAYDGALVVVILQIDAVVKKLLTTLKM